jgi:hypothetical protein
MHQQCSSFLERTVVGVTAFVKFSTFIEYHYLDYTTTFLSTQIRTFTRRNGAEIDVSNVNFGDLGQHLVGAGVRFHF